ncbi:putative transcription initiation factor lef-5 [Microplitis demolitor]|uniref:putative transcription initiation factor lef-5 n=1 Tax=Microplitis demolitor TaxID=69319 RepID=UPI00044002CA|nr:putative transcription initiation factor lef-5 [Microplitis demolitor]KAG6558455.1 putative transcription initiation factor lef-5 [Microplitis demolitor]
MKKFKNESNMGTKNNGRPRPVENNKLNILRQMRSNNLFRTSRCDNNHDGSLESTSSDTILLMDNFVCPLFDINILSDSQLPEFQFNSDIDHAYSEFSTCKHNFEIISHQSRAADELSSIMKICNKCNAVFAEKK